MVTVVTKTIGTGGGRDYSTLQSWEDAAPANLVTSDQVWRGECYNDAEFTSALTVSGSTVDATRYKELTVASGQAFADHANKLTNALRYNASNGAGLRSTTAWGTALTASESYFRISRLQVYQDSSNGPALQISGQGAVVDGVISESRGGRALYLYSNGTAKNSLFVSRRASASEVADIWDGCSVANCTFAVPSDIAAATRVIRRSYWSGNTFTNCGFFGGTDAVSSATGATFSNCYTNDSTSIPSGCTTVAYDTSTGSGFENTLDGTHDYRIKSTSALKDAGTSTGAPSVDIVGTTRPQGGAYDVGAWEYASAGSNGTASGATLTASSSLIQGSASGQVNATASGATVSAAASIIAGAASGQISATAPAATLTASASITAGSATGTISASASGATITAAASLVPGSASGASAGTASGVTLTAACSLIAGSASGASAGTAAGQTITAAASLITGSATGQVNATASGVVLTAAAVVVAGAASAANDATATGATLTVVASITAGSASGGTGVQDATAAGATMTATLQLVAGGAYGPSLAGSPGFRAIGRPGLYTARIGADGRTLPRRRASA